MKSILFGAALTLAGISLATTGAEAKGCIKGAVVGGVAGHRVGHGKMGAAAGCAVGHNGANRKDQPPSGGQQRPQQNCSPEPPPAATASTAGGAEKAGRAFWGRAFPEISPQSDQAGEKDLVMEDLRGGIAWRPKFREQGLEKSGSR